MSDNTTWVRDAEGARARINSADLDTFKPLGWVETDEPDPAGEYFVWLQHEVHEGKQRFPVAVAAQWEALGWHPCPPPSPVDLTRDPLLVDQPPRDAEPDPAPPKKPTKVATSGGSTKES